MAMNSACQVEFTLRGLVFLYDGGLVWSFCACGHDAIAHMCLNEDEATEDFIPFKKPLELGRCRRYACFCATYRVSRAHG